MNSIPRMARLGLATAMVASLTACDGSGPTTPPDASISPVDASVLASRVRGPRPLEGKIDGIGTVGDPCSADPPGLLVTATGHGTVRHLGASTLVQTACVAVADFTPLGPSEVALIAANGDRLEGLAAAFVFRPDGFDFEVSITGGTGRFWQAGGEYAVHVQQSAPLQPFSASMDGWIEY